MDPDVTPEEGGVVSFRPVVEPQMSRLETPTDSLLQSRPAPRSSVTLATLTRTRLLGGKVKVQGETGGVFSVFR